MAVDGSEHSGTGDDESTLPTCSSCGSPVAMVTVSEPLEAVANPCGCRLTPEAPEFE